MVTTTECQVLFRPDSAELRFLPEGPYALADGRVSWVGIQHGAKATVGSVNILNPATAVNNCFELPGRPGFAFPTSQPDVFVCGVERSLGLFNTATGSWSEFQGGVDDAVENTIINDGVVFQDNLIFGCKDLEFQTKKAGLYLWRGADRRLIQLRDDQICSNGKAVTQGEDGTVSLIDIDSPSKTVTRAVLDVPGGSLEEPQVLLDLTSEDNFPDGMITTPDQKSVIIAFYDPGDPAFGVARQYSLASGDLEAVWTCPGSPRVTCPQLIRIGTDVHLVLTTAVEHMEAEQQRRHPNAGALFAGVTSFPSVGSQPVLDIASA
ncbi:MAG: SMP-30/gluconolactonase/LRE family protein [Fuerstiella sp.]